MIYLNNSEYPSLLKRGSSHYLKKDDALKFLEQCLEHGIEIYNFEGFIITKNYTIPLMDLIIDFSSAISAKQTCEGSIKFLKTINDEDIYYDIFVDKKELLVIN